MIRALLGILLLTASALAAPKTVRDFYLLLPGQYFEVHDKQAHLKTLLTVEDPKNGYLETHGDAGQAGLQMALFKRPDGSTLVGVTTEGEVTCASYFLQYESGIWVDVSKQLIPGYAKGNVYELPRYGTTVHVYKKNMDGEACLGRSKKLYDLTWKHGKFTR